MDRRDFLQLASLTAIGLFAPISNSIIEAPNAQAVFITCISKEIKNGLPYSKITGGDIFADIYGFNVDSNKFDKMIVKDNYRLQKNEPFHIIYSEYVTDEDNQQVCFTSTKRNVVITNYEQIGENVFTDINYDTDSSVAKRLEYDYEIKDRSIFKGRKNKLYTVANSKVQYTLPLYT